VPRFSLETLRHCATSVDITRRINDFTDNLIGFFKDQSEIDLGSPVHIVSEVLLPDGEGIIDLHCVPQVISVFGCTLLDVTGVSYDCSPD
jgi:hypothetical protein